MARDPLKVASKAASVRDRLKASAKVKKVDTMALIARFALERWLARLAAGDYRGKFVIKGGMIMPLLGDLHRATDDIDIHGDDDMTTDQVTEFVRAVSGTEPPDEDGLTFDASAPRVEAIREGVLPGARVSFPAWLGIPGDRGSSQIRVKIDLCYGDAITPDPVLVEIPSSLAGFPSVAMSVFPWETVVAEKLHALVRHGATNSRLKDYYDLAVVSRSVGMDGRVASEAVRATFRRWGETRIPAEPVGLSDRFAEAREVDWKRFKKANDLKLDLPLFSDVVAEIRLFVLPLLEAASQGKNLDCDWNPGTGWEAIPSALPTGP